MIRTAELARIMHDTNPEYRVYEYNDMLTVLTNTLVALAVQGEVVQLRNFGTFYQYQTKPRVVFDPVLLTHKQHDGNIMLKFKPARTIQDRIKAIVQQERNQDAKT